MEVAIRTEHLTKTFGSTQALVDLNLEVPVGEVLGYLGPNGAGKTTTIRLLLGLIGATRGRAEVFGIDAQAQPVEAHRRVAYVPGEANLWPSLTGEETLHLLGRVHGQVDTAYRDLLIDRFEFDPSKKVRALSKGNRQKLILIAGLMTRADLLLLDEPTAGLDPLMERAFQEGMAESRQRGQTVFLSSHILSEVEALCDRIAILRAGHLVEVGTLAQMRHLSALQVEAEFDGTVPNLATVPGVSAVEVDGHRARFQVAGPTEPVLAVLAAEVGLGDLLAAGLNVVPPAVFILGIGGLAFGLRPRAAIGVVYGVVVWSFIVETIAAAFDSNHWLRDTSPFLHIAPVPAADPNWTAAFWLVALGLAAAAVGVAAFSRRDLAGA